MIDRQRPARTIIKDLRASLSSLFKALFMGFANTPHGHRPSFFVTRNFNSSTFDNRNFSKGDVFASL